MMQIHDINDFDYRHDTIIDASAGTGKTYTITSLIVPHLLEHTNYSLVNILIVTYTEKAAGELRNRIRKELIKLSETLDDASHPKLKEKINREIETIDDAPIFTFHAFCHKVLTENTIYSNRSCNMTLIDENVGLDIFIGKYIRDKLSQDDTFVRLLLLYADDKKDFNDALCDFQNIIKEAVKKYYLNNGRETENIISLEPLTDEQVQEYNTFRISGEYENLDAIRAYFVTEHLKEIYMAWQNEKNTKNKQTYTDIITSVYDALTVQNSQLLRILKKQYNYAIIDEFQDTNTLQWNIFKQIFTTDDDHHMTIVGDPKQSIFAFQGADPNVYDIAKNYLTQTREAAIWSLDTNYRSSAPMIKAINTLCKSSSTIVNTAATPYHDCKAPNNEKCIKPAQINGQTTQPVHIITGTKQTTADTIVSKIIEYCTKDSDGKTNLQIWDKDANKYRDVNFSDFTVLVRDRANANELIAKMTDAQIPFMWHKDASLFTGKESGDWISLLSAINTTDFYSSKRTILRRALQTAFFDIALANIDDEKYNDILCPERQMLLKWQNLAQTMQYAKLINAIFEDSNIASRMADYSHIQSLAKYNQIGNFILDSATSKHMSLTNIIKTLNRRQKRFQDADDAISVERPTDNHTVKLSTIHSAKGLEFPVVFYIIRSKKIPTTYVCVTRDNNKASLNITTGKFQDTSEETRLRYVAITRASSLMFLVQNQKGLKIAQKNICDQVLFTEDPIVSTTKTASEILMDTNDESNDTNTDDADIMPGVIPLSAKKLYKHSYTSLSHHVPDVEADIKSTAPIEQLQRIDKDEDCNLTPTISLRQFDADNGVDIHNRIYDTTNITHVTADATGIRYGTLVHDVFEHINFQAFIPGNVMNNKYDLMQIINACCKRNLVKCSQDKIADLVINTMAATLPEISGGIATGNKFSLSTLAQRDRKSEIEFNLNASLGDKLQNYCNGFMDLLFVRDINGRQVYSVLDWKTDLFDQDETYANYDYLKAHTDDKYAIQRVLYSYCLIQWLKQFYPDATNADIFNNHFGGIYYVYVRGCNAGTSNGIYAHTWNNYDALHNAFTRIMHTVYKGENNA